MAGGLLSGHLYFRSRDLEETREMVARVYCDHRLRLLEGNCLDAFQYQAKLGSLSMSYMQYGERVSIDPGQLGSFYLIQMPCSGEAEVRTGDRLVHSTPQTASIADPAKDLRMVWSKDCVKLMLKIDAAALTRYANATVLDGQSPCSVVFEPEFDLTADPGRHWMALMGLIESYLSTFPTAPGSALVTKSYEDMVLSFLLLHHPHNLSRHLGSCPVAQVAPRHVKRAEEFMRAHAGEPITMAEVTREAGVSLRCLQDGFRRFRGTSPHQALTQIRLDGVRTELLECDATRSVTDAALKWGFGHFGRFSSSYHKRFGELPSETRRKSR